MMVAATSGPTAAHAQTRTVAATASGLEKERALQSEAHSWAAPNDPDAIPFATLEQIPVLDLEDPTFAERLREVSTSVGFYMLKNHGVPEEEIEAGFAASEEFHALPEATKLQYEMDRKDTQYPGGCGYLPVNNFKLPKRVKGNQTATFIVKREHGPRDVTLDRNPWPKELPPAWRERIERYAGFMEDLSMRMLPKYAAALAMEDGYFASSFESPLWRLRMGMYPATAGYEASQYGISPHVDTSFFTILAQREPGLVVHDEATSRWLRVRHIPGTLVVNSGEILRNMTNDTWLATRHYALNVGSATPRYSIPFFFCPTADHPVAVVPSTITEDRPAKYSPASYLDGQGVAQGE